jgi:putative acetyltransferase
MAHRRPILYSCGRYWVNVPDDEVMWSHATSPKVGFVVHVCAPEDADLVELLQQGYEEFRVRYPELEDRRGPLFPDIQFLVVRRDGESLGCCAFQACRGAAMGNAFELKRLFITPRARGSGAVDALMAAFEDLAITLGAERLCFETGPRQPEAIAVGHRHGYQRVDPYPPYCDDPFAICFAKVCGG